MAGPAVSVVVCVYNGEEYLAQALDSICAQTFRDWECVVIDDGSADRTAAILDQYARKDARFRMYRNERNLGIPRSRNRALELVEGQYVAFMDADDISRRDRLERQVEFMWANPSLELCSCKYFLLREGELLPRASIWRGDEQSVRALFLFFNPILNPGVMGKREALQALGYDPACSCTEDLDIWLRMLRAGCRLAVQPDYLMCYRLHEKQITANTKQRQREQYRQMIGKFYGDTLFPLTAGEEEFLATGVYFRDEPDIRRLKELFRRIWQANRKKKSFAPEAVRYAMWELLLEYRRCGAPAAPLVPAVLEMGPGFLWKEMGRRRRAAVEDRVKQEEAYKLFALQKNAHG